MNDMKAKIISLKGIEFEGEIQSFTVRTQNGEITVLNHHHPLVTLLASSKARLVTETNEEKIFDIQEGVLRVDPNNQLTALIR